MKREFVETKAFSEDWKALGQSDEDLRALQNLLAEHPDGGPVIEKPAGLGRSVVAEAVGLRARAVVSGF